jgi:hypothetical protein
VKKDLVEKCLAIKVEHLTSVVLKPTVCWLEGRSQTEGCVWISRSKIIVGSIWLKYVSSVKTVRCAAKSPRSDSRFSQFGHFCFEVMAFVGGWRLSPKLRDSQTCNKSKISETRWPNFACDVQPLHKKSNNRTLGLAVLPKI